jgi:CRISPR-associated exonuclease Cas4
MQITATLINLYHVCHRELWLHAHEIRMEHSSDLVAEGKLIGETTYQRRPEQYTQVELDGIKIDFFDPHTRTVHETKRGRAMEAAHRAQVQYYLYKLRLHGVQDARGLIEYPDLRRTETVEALNEADMTEITRWENEIVQIIAQEDCPDVIRAKICNHCSYHDFCYAADLD